MKTTQVIRQLKKIYSLVVFILFSQLLFAGDTGDKNTVKYRVTAIKKTESSVVSESNIVEVNIPLSIYIPTAFTPNGDGLNDNFGISGEGISDFYMSIFNKWGDVIFETKNMNNQWDGTFGGETAPDGAYLYYIKLRTTDKQSLIKNGTISVLK